MRKNAIKTSIILLTLFFLTGCFRGNFPYYTVEFYAEEALIKREVVRRSYFATYPEAPEISGYTFIAWDTESEPVRSDLKINAIYEINHYQINYIYDGDDVGNPTSYTVLDEVILNKPSKDGYLFIGWFLEGIKVEKIEKGTVGDLTLVAVFDEKFHYVRQDKEALENEYKNILTGTIDHLDSLPLVGNINQSKITWQSNSTAFYVNPETGEVTITKGKNVQEVIIYAIIEKDNYVELCEFKFNISN